MRPLATEYCLSGLGFAGVKAGGSRFLKETDSDHEELGWTENSTGSPKVKPHAHEVSWAEAVGMRRRSVDRLECLLEGLLFLLSLPEALRRR